MSPSARREWIEIFFFGRDLTDGSDESPSARREWIEIAPALRGLAGAGASPSARREWIEMLALVCSSSATSVSLREEGVD